ncbi:MAG: Gfo/Idh/MocA family oxidoreductase [Victivallales bacterium]|nr:Gfo/Idh/MocA family oxidoreductase [Victivallales bacterium]
MKKKIGLIDLFIDEWHSNHLPEWIASSNRKDEFELAYAWEEAPFPGRRNLQEWCGDNNMIAAKSIEEVVENCDVISVLAPANPEVHARLADIPLRSGKPVYVDKPFADTLAAAKGMFDLAERHSTPLMTSSALRFCEEIQSGKLQAMKPILFNTLGGGRSFPEYAIHQLEMIVAVMGTDIRDIQLVGDAKKLSLALKYGNSRLATATYAVYFPFAISAASETDAAAYSTATGYWVNFVNAMLDFFATGVSPIPREQTLCIAEVLEKAVALLQNARL